MTDEPRPADDPVEQPAADVTPRASGAVGIVTACSVAADRRLARALDDPEVVAEASRMSLTSAARIVGQTLHFGDPEIHPVIFLLAAAQTHLVGLLDSLFILGIRGPVGSGKSSAARAFRVLGKNVALAATITPPVLAQLARTFNGIVIDRFDRRLKSDDHDLIEQIVDTSYERGLSFIKMVARVSGGWDPAAYDVFGVRVLTYAGEIGEFAASTASRTVEIEMVPAHSFEVRLANRRIERALASVSLWLTVQCERINEEWTAESFEGLTGTPEFREFASGLDSELVGMEAGDRIAQLAENMWLLARVLGWNVDDALRTWLSRSASGPSRPGDWTAVDEERWAKLAREALVAFCTSQLSLRKEDAADWVVPSDWHHRAPRVGVLGWIARFAGRADGGLPPRPKAIVMTEMRKLGLLTFPGKSEKVSERHDRGDQRLAVFIDAACLRALGLVVREESSPPPAVDAAQLAGDGQPREPQAPNCKDRGTVPLQGPVRPVRPVRIADFLTEEDGPEGPDLFPVRPVRAGPNLMLTDRADRRAPEGSGP